MDESSLLPAAQRIIEAREIWRLISAEGAGDDGIEPAVLFSDLHAYVTGNQPIMAPRLARALTANTALQDDLRALIDDLARYRSERVAAASGAATPVRRGPEFELELRPSRADASQVYVVIRLSQGGDPPSNLFVRAPGGAIEKAVLPEPASGRIQLLFSDSAAIIRALQDPDSEVSLV
jgi:hypothetical protein